jgi:hypothetical protein
LSSPAFDDHIGCFIKMNFSDEELKILAVALEWSQKPEEKDHWQGDTQLLFEKIFRHLRKVDPQWAEDFKCAPDQFMKPSRKIGWGGGN